jgi:hypothetical protein
MLGTATLQVRGRAGRVVAMPRCAGVFIVPDMAMLPLAPSQIGLFAAGLIWRGGTPGLQIKIYTSEIYVRLNPCVTRHLGDPGFIRLIYFILSIKRVREVTQSKGRHTMNDIHTALHRHPALSIR